MVEKYRTASKKATIIDKTAKIGLKLIIAITEKIRIKIFRKKNIEKFVI